MEWLQTLGIEALYVVLGIVAGLTLLDDALADAVARVPYIGRVLAPIVRRLSGRFREWIGSRVPASADRVVRDMEAATTGAPGSVKLKLATRALQDAEPGLIEPEAREAVQAAVDRAKATPALQDSRLGELEALLSAQTAPTGVIPGDAHGRAE